MMDLRELKDGFLIRKIEMELSHARYLATTVIAKLMPHCQQIKVCGSMRRQKSIVSDIDIVVLPKRNPVKDLFGAIIKYTPCQEFLDQVDSWEKLRGEATGKYTQRLFEGEKLELSIACPENFGCLVLIRTGDSDFSHMLMTRALKCGLQQRDGYLWRDDKMIPIATEEEYFNVLDLPFIKPEFRDKNAFKHVKVCH